MLTLKQTDAGESNLPHANLSYHSYRIPVSLPWQSRDKPLPMPEGEEEDHDEDVVKVPRFPMILILPCLCSHEGIPNLQR